MKKNQFITMYVLSSMSRVTTFSLLYVLGCTKYAFGLIEQV